MGIENLNDMINQLDIIDIHRTYYLKTEDYTFFFQVHLGHLPKYSGPWSMIKFHRIEIIQYMFSDHCGINYNSGTENNYQGSKCLKINQDISK